MEDKTKYIEDKIKELGSALEDSDPSLEEKVDATYYLINAMCQAMCLQMTGSKDSVVVKGAGPLLAAIGKSMGDLYGQKAQDAFLDAWTGGEYSSVSEMKKAGLSNNDIEQFYKKGGKYES